MRKLFIAGTGTGVGKTYVTALLARHWRGQGRQVKALKPVISGFSFADLHNDTALLLAACGLEYSEANVQAISPWRFAAPLSPDMAARREGKSMTLKAMADFCQRAAQADITLTEGAGGLMSPVNEDSTMLDLMAALGWPSLLVTGSYLGGLSHTLTALEAMQQRRKVPLAVIVSESEGGVALDETCATLRRFAPCPVMALPRLAQDTDLCDRLWPML